jgi:hypothetical protein
VSAEDAVQRAKNELLEHERKINLLDSEKARIEMQRHAAVRERDRVKAFIDLFPKFVLDAGTVFEVRPQPTLANSSEAPKVAPWHPGKESRGVPAKAKGKKTKRTKGTKLQRKPENLPTMTEMILLALKDAKANGKTGMKPQEITSFVASKWWPSVKSSSVGPIAWRMFDRKELRKNGEIYMLPADSGEEFKVKPLPGPFTKATEAAE